MDEFDQKLDAILGNADLMQQIMSLANQLNTAESQKKEETRETRPKEAPQSGGVVPPLDGNVIRGISNLLNNTGIDKDQRALLNALKPYIGTAKAQKLEKAMQASKMAQLASVYLNNGNVRHAAGG